MDTWPVRVSPRNLFVGEASVVPGSTGVNPQVTIQAMAMRIADAVIDRLG